MGIREQGRIYLHRYCKEVQGTGLAKIGKKWTVDIQWGVALTQIIVTNVTELS